MGRPPRSQKPHVQRPSPLQQVHLTRPISHVPPTSGLVRDPLFWKRFSTAVHMTEVPVDDEEKGAQSRKNSKSTSSSLDKEGNDWLAQQAKEKRRCRIVCMSITLAVLLVVIAAAIVGWYFTKVRKI